MESFATVFREAGFIAWFQLFGLFAGGLWALVCGGLLAARWKVPPIVGVLPLGLVPFTAILGTWAGQSSIDAALGNVEPSQRAMLLAAGVAELLAQGWFGLVAVPAALLLGFGGLAAGIRAPRAWGMPAGVFLLLGLVALLPVLGFFWGASPAWVIGRVLLYGLAVIPVALSTANAHPASNGPEGGVTATLAFASVVAATELACLSASWASGFGALATVDPEQRATVLSFLQTEVGAQTNLAWVLLLLASLPAFFAVFRSGPTLTEEEILAGHAGAAPGRSAGRLLALGVILLWFGAFLAFDASDALATIAKAAA